MGRIALRKSSLIASPDHQSTCAEGSPLALAVVWSLTGGKSLKNSQVWFSTWSCNTVGALWMSRAVVVPSCTGRCIVRGSTVPQWLCNWLSGLGLDSVSLKLACKLRTGKFPKIRCQPVSFLDGWGAIAQSIWLMPCFCKNGITVNLASASVPLLIRVVLPRSWITTTGSPNVANTVIRMRCRDAYPTGITIIPIPTNPAIHQWRCDRCHTQTNRTKPYNASNCITLMVPTANELPGNWLPHSASLINPCVG